MIEERFAPTGGKVPGVLGLALAVSIIVTALLEDESHIAPWGIALALLIAAVSWTALLRPGLAVVDRRLVMRNMFTTFSIPLRLVDSVAVRQVTAVSVGEKRYVCAAVGRNRGQLKRDQPGPRPGRGNDSSRFGGLSFGALGLSARAPGPEHESTRGQKSMSYGFYVEDKLRRAVEETKQHAADTDEPQQVSLKIAWPEVVAVLATTVAFVVLLAR